MNFAAHIQDITQTRKVEQDLKIIKNNSLQLWTEQLEDELDRPQELTKQDFKDIDDLIQTVDKILDLNTIDTDRDYQNINRFKEHIKQKYRLSNIDIFKFRLANANCMRCIALFPGINDILPGSDNRITQKQGGVAYNAVFTIHDLFYSRNKQCEFSNANWITPDLFLTWFTKPWNKVQQYNLRTLVQTSYQMEPQLPNIETFLIADPNNLMINIFILFLALSDGIATLSMYTAPGAEPEYYYKSDSVDMAEILLLFHNNKSAILNILASKLSQAQAQAQAQGQPINPIDILNDMMTEQSGRPEIYMIISTMLETYSNVYYGKQTTNLSNDLNNEFFQHYQVKFTLFTTMVVSLIKDKLRKKCTPATCKPPSADKQKDICNKDNVKKDINKKRQETRELNKQKSLNASKAQEIDLRRQREVQALNRSERAERRRTGGGGSTKIVLYLVKIEKIRELNKKLRKNKTKNKSKIEKNNKLIDELKLKIKKQKEKEKLKKQKDKKLEKEKLKKQKEKEKLKKQKEKEKEKKKEKSKKKQKK